jgi:hypothetical protein
MGRIGQPPARRANRGSQALVEQRAKQFRRDRRALPRFGFLTVANPGHSLLPASSPEGDFAGPAEDPPKGTDALQVSSEGVAFGFGMGRDRSGSHICESSRQGFINECSNRT